MDQEEEGGEVQRSVLVGRASSDSFPSPQSFRSVRPAHLIVAHRFDQSLFVIWSYQRPGTRCNGFDIISSPLAVIHVDESDFHPHRFLGFLSIFGVSCYFEMVSISGGRDISGSFGACGALLLILREWKLGGMISSFSLYIYTLI